jgi:DNA polymerase III subunit beta
MLMKILCDRELLLDAFGMVSGVVPTRSPKPILQQVKLTVTSEGSTLMGTDLEVGIRFQVLGVKVDRSGSVILPFQRMGSILRTSLGDDELAIEADDEHILVRGHRSQFKLPADDPEAFPDPPELAVGSAGYVIAATDLRKLIRRTIFATDPDSTRYALGGVLVELGNETITMVGTDGRRLARQITGTQVEGTGTTAIGPPPVIPVKALRLIERNLDDAEPVHIAVQDATAALVRTGRAVIYSRLVEGRFPNYREVFPASHEARILFKEVEPLLQAAEQSAITTSKESRGVDFLFSDGMLRLTSQSPDVGSSDIELPIDYDGKNIGITFDAAYLLEALRTLEPSQAIAAELTDGRNPGVFKTDDGYTYVVMPLNR